MGIAVGRDNLEVAILVREVAMCFDQVGFLPDRRQDSRTLNVSLNLRDHPLGRITGDIHRIDTGSVALGLTCSFQTPCSDRKRLRVITSLQLALPGAIGAHHPVLSPESRTWPLDTATHGRPAQA